MPSATPSSATCCVRLNGPQAATCPTGPASGWRPRRQHSVGRFQHRRRRPTSFGSSRRRTRLIRYCAVTESRSGSTLGPERPAARTTSGGRYRRYLHRDSRTRRHAAARPAVAQRRRLSYCKVRLDRRSLPDCREPHRRGEQPADPRAAVECHLGHVPRCRAAGQPVCRAGVARSGYRAGSHRGAVHPRPGAECRQQLRPVSLRSRLLARWQSGVGELLAHSAPGSTISWRWPAASPRPRKIPQLPTGCTGG